MADGLVVRVEGLARVRQLLGGLPREVEQKGGAAVRLGLRKGLEPMRQAAIGLLDQTIAEVNVDGRFVSTGLLRKSIVVRRSKMPPGVKGERYALRVSKKRYPDTGGKPVVTPQVARLLEYGTETMAPRPFIRPAFEAQKVQAAEVAVKTIEERLGVVLRSIR